MLVLAKDRTSHRRDEGSRSASRKAAEKKMAIHLLIERLINRSVFGLH